MRLFFKNYQNQTNLTKSEALEASIFQTLDIFDDLPENDDSFLCLINTNNEVLKFCKHNKFVWLIEIPKPSMGGSFQGYYTRQRCREIIKKVFNQTEFKNISGLKFEKYL